MAEMLGEFPHKLWKGPICMQIGTNYSMIGKKRRGGEIVSEGGGSGGGCLSLLNPLAVLPGEAVFLDDLIGRPLY